MNYVRRLAAKLGPNRLSLLILIAALILICLPAILIFAPLVANILCTDQPAQCGAAFHANERSILLTAWLIFTASAVASATICMWTLGHSALQLFQENSKRAVRAYFAPKDCEVAVSNVHDFVICLVTLRFKNEGKTPAHAAHVYGVIDLLAWPLPDPFPKPNMGRASLDKASAAPQAERSWSTEYKLSKDQWADINSGKLVLAIYGTAAYTDVFGKTCTSEFRLILGGDRPLVRLRNSDRGIVYGAVPAIAGNSMT